MLFNSFSFLLFFPLVVLGYFVVPQKVRNYWLLVASYYFYMSWNAKYALLLLFCTFVTFFASIIIEQKKSKRILSIGLVLVFSALAYYKYFNFFLENIIKMASIFHIQLAVKEWDIVLPVGISFFSFQAVGYMIDVYRGEIKAEHNFFRFALFVSFFPQLVAGPIERSKNLLKQLEKMYAFSYNRARDGLFLMLWGYFLKLVIADRAAIFIDSVFMVDKNPGGILIIIATILFAFQIYCDFSGYSLIAMGAAKIIGIQLMENFNSPYLALSTKEFWNRWHISLNTWFRDYLYIPLGGNRKGQLRKYLNLMIVFLVSGLWHGASWNFVAWGGLNGLYQIIGDRLSTIREKIVKGMQVRVDTFSYRLLKGLLTFIFIDFAWLFFRANGIEDAIKKVITIFTDFRIKELAPSSLYSLGLDEKNFRLLILSIIILLIADWIKNKGYCIRELIFKQQAWFRIVVFVFGVLFVLVFGIWGNAYNSQSFIYFRF